MVLSIVTELCNHHSYLIFSPIKRNPIPISTMCSAPPLTVPENHHEIFCDWLLSLSTVFSRSNPAVTYIGTSFLFYDRISSCVFINVSAGRWFRRQQACYQWLASRLISDLSLIAIGNVTQIIRPYDTLFSFCPANHKTQVSIQCLHLVHENRYKWERKAVM